MRFVFATLMMVMFLGGCSNTWYGVKQDTKNSAEWTKEKVNEGATYVKEKTQ